jgi:hypothetical protein
MEFFKQFFLPSLPREDQMAIESPWTTIKHKATIDPNELLMSSLLYAFGVLVIGALFIFSVNTNPLPSLPL